jgi:hypothetical protein
MAIRFETKNPAALLAAYKKAIDDKHVVTWAYDSDGDFYHTPEQWREYGWLRPSVDGGVLTLRFLAKPNKVTTWEAWGVHHGRFVESMMAHCNSLYAEAHIPPAPSSQDTVTTKAA